VNGPLFGPNPAGTPPFNAFSVVQNFKTPRYHNFNLSLQNELFHNNVLTVTYSGQRGRDLIIYSEPNPTILLEELATKDSRRSNISSQMED